MSRDRPTLEFAIDTAIQNALSTVYTAMPGIVDKYDASAQKADIQPNLKRVDFNGKDIQLPILPNVPIVFPRTEKSFISFPVKKGDQVLLIFSQRSLDDWLSIKEGGDRIIRPGSTRRFDLADAVAIPGLYPFSDTIDASEDNVRIQNEDSRLDMTPDGKFAFKSKASGKELINILIDLVTALKDTVKTNTLLGPQPLVPPTPFTTAITDLTTLKAE